MARPTILTSELIEGIAVLVEQGVHPEIACRAFGVSRRAYYLWLSKGRAMDSDEQVETSLPSDPVYLEFVHRLELAEARCESALVGLAVARARTSSDALAVLARRFGDRWRERVDVHVELEEQVRRLAEETGVDYAEALAEAERFLAEAQR